MHTMAYCIKDLARREHIFQVVTPDLPADFPALRSLDRYRPAFPVIIEFPSLAHARRWYNSEEYRELKALRLAATTSNAYFVEGIPEEG